MRCRNAIGLDRDGDCLYAIELSLLREGAVLRKAWRGAADPADATGGGLHRAVAEAGFTSRAAAISVPRAGAVHRILDVPQLPAAETRAAAAAALEDKVPYAAADICLGWERRKGKVLAAAAERGLVEKHRAALLEAGLTPIRMDLRPAAVAAAFWHGYGTESAGRLVALLELRTEESTVILLRDGELLYSRALPGLGEDGLSNLPAFAGALRQTYALLRMRPDWLEPDCLWLAGTWAGRTEVRERLAATMGVDPGLFVPAKPKCLLRPANQPEPGPEMMAAAGQCLTALGFPSPAPDLLPGLAKDSRHWLASPAVPLALCALLSLGGLQLLSAASTRRLSVVSAWLAARQDRIESLRDKRAEINAMRDRLALLTSYGSRTRSYLDLVSALTRALPPGTRLTRLAVRDGQVEAAEGTTPSVSLLLERLRTEEILNRLRLRGQAATRIVDGRQVEAFVLTGPFGAEEAQP